MVLSADYRRLLRKEVKAYTEVQKSFKKQAKRLEENVEELYNNYTVNIWLAYNYLQNANVHIYPMKKSWEDEYGDEPLAWFWRAMGINEMIEKLGPIIAKSYEKGYKLSYRLFKKKLEENGFNYYPELISDYEKYWGELNLSNYKGAISYTTKRDIVKILKDWIDNHLGGTEIRKRIAEYNPILFSKARARAIAVTEMHKAYEFWNLQPMQQLNSVWIPVKKKRLTVGDDKVRPEHTACEDEGRVDISYVYPSVWVDIPPGWVNCRCTILYHID